MAATLLEIVQDICAELGIPRPASVTDSTDFQIQQIYALVNREGRELQQNYEWTALQTEYDLHVDAPVITIGTVILNSYTVYDIPSASLVGVTPNNWVITGLGIPIAARITGVGPNSVTMDMPASSSADAFSLLATEGGSEISTEDGTLIGFGGQSITLSHDTYPEPSDFGRFINATWWDRTNQWSLMGPDSPQRYQWEVSGVVTTGPRRHFRQVGPAPNNYRLWPPPGALDTPINLAFEYISTNWARSALGIPQPKFLADDDTSILDSNFFVLGGKWRFWQAKQLDYAPFQQEYIDYVDRAYSQDGGSKTLNLLKDSEPFLLSPGQTPDGNWPY